MATSYKTIAQAHLTSTSDTDIYTVPSATETIVSTLVVANITGSATTFNIAIRQDGATLANKHYIAREVPIAANDSTTLTLGIALEATDVVTVTAGAADALSFNLFGAEIDV
jgi:uncharacterized protein YfaS (alpha-2-macroglobulin family)